MVAPDQIGFGKSSKPHAYQFTFQALAENTRGLLDHLGVGRVHVVGHSMGGMLGTRFALMFPDRTDRLVLVNPIGLEDWKTVVPYRTVDEFFADELEATPESVREYERTSYFGGEWKPEYDPLVSDSGGLDEGSRLRDRRVERRSDLGHDLHAAGSLRVPSDQIRDAPDHRAAGSDRVRPRRGQPKSVAETLGNYPVLGRKAAAAIPRAQLVEIADAGHLPQVEAFDQYIGALVPFLLGELPRGDI